MIACCELRLRTITYNGHPKVPAAVVATSEAFDRRPLHRCSYVSGQSHISEIKRHLSVWNEIFEAASFTDSAEDNTLPCPEDLYHDWHDALFIQPLGEGANAEELELNSYFEEGKGSFSGGKGHFANSSRLWEADISFNEQVQHIERAEESSFNEEDVLLQEARYRALGSYRDSLKLEKWKTKALQVAMEVTEKSGEAEGPKHENLKTLREVIENGRHTHLQKLEEWKSKLWKALTEAGKKRSSSFDCSMDHENRQQHVVSQLQPTKNQLSADVFGFSYVGTLLNGKVGASVIFAWAFVYIFGLILSTQHSKTPSVKRRILRSQWYGEHSAQAWGQKDFQMKICEFPKYTLLEVDGDRKVLRFPASNGSGMKKHCQNPKRTFSEEGLKVKPRNQASLGFPSLKRAQSEKDRNVNYLSSEFKISSHKPLTNIFGHGSRKEDGGINPVQRPGTKDSRFGRLYRRPEQHQTIDVTKPASETSGFSRQARTHGPWQEEDELDLGRRIKRLYQTIDAVERHRRAAMLMLAEERQRSTNLEEEMIKQKEVAAVLAEEVRLLQESHEALLSSLQKKYSSSAAIRAAADLVYQDWALADTGEGL